MDILVAFLLAVASGDARSDSALTAPSPAQAPLGALTSPKTASFVAQDGDKKDGDGKDESKEKKGKKKKKGEKDKDGDDKDEKKGKDKEGDDDEREDGNKKR